MITLEVAQKVLSVVDKGLTNGLGVPQPGRMCVEAAVSYALGLPHGDSPSCVTPILRVLKISLNDKPWSSHAVRAKGLRRLALAQLGSADIFDESDFARRICEIAIRKQVPIAVRAAASLLHGKSKVDLMSAALQCEEEGTYEATYAANTVTYAATNAARTTSYAAASATSYAASATSYATAATAAATAAAATATAAAER